MQTVTHRRLIPLALSIFVGLALNACAGNRSPAELVGMKTAGSESALSATSASQIMPVLGKNMCLQPQNKALYNGTPLVLAKCDGSSEQAWMLVQGTLRIFGNLCADVTDGVNKDGTRLQLWDCSPGNNNQKWTESDKALAWTGKKKCIDVVNGAASEGSVMQIWSCSGSTNQQWKTVASSASGSGQGNDSTANPTNTPVPGGFASGYLHTSGSSILDGSGNAIKLRGTNVGGWLVTENWMCGISDDSDNNGTSSGNSHMRFARDTLERRFGEAKALELMNVWYDNFITSSDFDNMRNIGINVIRVPFGWRNLQHPDGSWVTDASGSIDFRRFDWIVSEAGKRGIYVVFDLHVWRNQRQNYWTISRTQEGGQAEQVQAAAIWTEVAKHFKGNTTIGAFDLINEAEGSGDNQLFKSLFSAIRAQDDKRMIVAESVHVMPRDLGWDNVVYDTHLYSMMGADFGSNQSAWGAFYGRDIQEYKGYNIPVLVGEFMAQDDNPTLGYLLGELNKNDLNWTNWAYKTVGMGSWGIYNLGANARVNVLNDSADAIKATWSNLGTAEPESRLINAMKAALGR